MTSEELTLIRERISGGKPPVGFMAWVCQMKDDSLKLCNEVERLQQTLREERLLAAKYSERDGP